MERDKGRNREREETDGECVGEKDSEGERQIKKESMYILCTCPQEREIERERERERERKREREREREPERGRERGKENMNTKFY